MNVLAIIMLTLSMFNTTKEEIDNLILKLKPSVSQRVRDTVSEAIVTYNDKSGLNDHRLVLAVIMTESAFIHKLTPGADGEWGMMQVIPGDGHIKQAALQYECTKEEENKWVNDDEFGYWRMCIGNKPNITHRGHVNPHAVARLIKHSPRAGIAIGIYELTFWRQLFQNSLKQRFWAKNHTPYRWGNWYDRVRRELGDRLYVCHYNYGARIKVSPVGYSYPLAIIRWLDKMKE